MTRPERAEQLFRDGYNCAQAVFGAYADLFGFDEETAMRIASSFGGGIGRLREVCGAVSGMMLVCGMKRGCAVNDDPAAKKEHYALVQKLAAEFREQNGAIVCRELLALPSGASEPTPEARTEKYYQRRPCAHYVRTAAEIVERELFGEQA